ncbi:hypothetical protein ACFO9Q_00310 [Paenibacillus sp. GCM10023252]|uniref:hypothetical protein n=1 Tax=Paenibacillus sp. GCM10023252 TaxID=3252649 RepID=UPI00361B0167
MEQTTNTNQPRLSYEEFQQQVKQRDEQMQAEARQAILNSGADRNSFKMRDLVIQLEGLTQEVQNAHNQLEAQINAQQRQLKIVQKKIEDITQQFRSTIPGASGMLQ